MLHGILIKIGIIVFCIARFEKMPITDGARIIATIPVGFRPNATRLGPVGTTHLIDDDVDEFYFQAGANGDLTISGVGSQVFINAWWHVV